MPDLWDLSIPSAPRQLAAAESIIVPRPTGAPLSGVWSTVLTLCDSLNPPREWLASAGYYVGLTVGADLGQGWQAPVIGVDAQGRPAALRHPVPIPVPPPPVDLRAAREEHARLTGLLEDAAVERLRRAVSPRYRASEEQAAWAALYSEAVAYQASGALGPYLLAEVGGLSTAERDARIGRIRAHGDAWVPYRAGVLVARSRLDAQLGTALAPWVDYEQAEAAYLAAVEAGTDPLPAMPDPEAARSAALAALDDVAPAIADDASWPALG